MLGTRIVTAVILLAMLLAILYVNSYPVFALALAVFFFAAAWEGGRLFEAKIPLLGAAVWTVAFLVLAFGGSLAWQDAQLAPGHAAFLACLSTVIWALRLAPSLAMGLPPTTTLASRLLSVIYILTVLACFVAMLALFQHSALYLFSVLALVWLADIGAYFSGKAFGKRKLAPSISPGKSWEGVVGGWITVIAIAVGSTFVAPLQNTFSAHVLQSWGWAGLIGVLTVIVAASVVGDLFESQLKRRIGMKDSSNLLPGHGGVLDRIDALIPVLSLAVFIGHWVP